MPLHTPKPRWTSARIFHTALYVVIGAIIGPAVTFAWCVLVMIGIAFIIQPFSAAVPLGIVVAVLTSFVPYLLIRSASYGTCKKHPTAPAGIAAGIAGGIFLISASFLLNAPWITLVALLPAIAFAAAAYQGGTRALRESLGQLRAGLGLTCAHCGYDVSATAEGKVCPECGGVMRYERASAS